jgi:hypothetical protein
MPHGRTAPEIRKPTSIGNPYLYRLDIRNATPKFMEKPTFFGDTEGWLGKNPPGGHKSS